MSENYDDFTLLAESIAGKREAWESLVKRYSKLIYFSINKTLKSYSHYLQEGDVADIHNSIFLSLLENNCKKLRQFKGKHGCSLSSWIRLISIRQTIDFLRSQKQHVSIDREEDEMSPLMERIPDKELPVKEQLELSENERILKKAMDELPSSDRFFVKLYYEKELPPEEIANIMHVSVSAIYSKNNRIREKIKNILKEKGFIARNSK